MDLNAALVILPLMVSGLMGLAWWSWQRQITKADEADKEAKAKLEARVTALEKAEGELRLEIERRITRDDLDKVFTAVNEVQKQVTAQGNETIKALATLVAGLKGGERG